MLTYENLLAEFGGKVFPDDLTKKAGSGRTYLGFHSQFNGEMREVFFQNGVRTFTQPKDSSYGIEIYLDNASIAQICFAVECEDDSDFWDMVKNNLS